MGHRYLTILIWATGLSALGGAARAEAEVRGLATGGSELVRSGLERLGPRLAVRLAASPMAALSEALAGELGALADHYPRDAAGPRALFVGSHGLSETGMTLVRWLERAKYHAVEVDVPASVAALLGAPAPELPVDAVKEAWEASRGATDRWAATVGALSGRTSSQEEVAKLARVERELAEALVTMARAWRPRPRTTNLHADAQGRYLSPDTLWQADPGDDEAVGLVFAAVARGELERWFVESGVQHPQYAALVKAAERYAEMCARGGFSEVALPRGKVSPEAIAALQRRLAEEGFYQGEAHGEWDGATEAAVAEVRRVRRLKEKGGLDQALVDVLSIPCEARLASLTRNVRRWRYSAWSGEQERVEVNLPEQIVRFFADGALVMKQRTVVGSDRSFFSKIEQRRVWRNATPIMSDKIASVVVNPEWNVPQRIAREEIEPEIAKDPEYLTKKRFRVIEGVGGKIYVQQSGAGNALGLVKILFPNSESIYLHDTPGKAAFRQPVRALSHGCVRVENALDFAGELVRADKAKLGEQFEASRIKALTQVSGKTWTFRLEKPIPVFLEYYTASVDEDGSIWFHPDIYGHDSQ